MFGSKKARNEREGERERDRERERERERKAGGAHRAVRAYCVF